MPRRKGESIPESLRWPTAFGDVVAMQYLVTQVKGWKNVVEDLRKFHRNLEHKIAHEVPNSAEKAMEQNFERGLLAGIERIVELEEEFNEWVKEHK